MRNLLDKFEQMHGGTSTIKSKMDYKGSISENNQNGRTCTSYQNTNA